MRLLLSIISLIITLQAAADSRTVCPDCEIRSIVQAIALSNDCDTIYINGGRYAEGVIEIDKPLALIGINNPVIDGKNESEILVASANHIVLEGLTFENVGTSYIKDWAAIRLIKSADFTIRNNVLHNTFFGIYLEHCKRGLVEGNRIIGDASDEASSGNAIHLWYTKEVDIINNYATGMRDGIYFEFADNCLIEGNVSEGNLRYGLHFMFSDNDLYRNNIFRDNGAGVAVMFSRRIEMTGNLFEKNWGRSAYGLLLKEINDAVIRENRFRENTTGIFVEGSNRIEYTANEFMGNGWAITVSGGCLDNRISGNNFFANTFDMAVQTNYNNNYLEGNFWQEYTGYDLDRNGIGDVPYRPVKLFNFLVSKTPETIVLLRSLFIDLLNYSEKISPVFTPKNVYDEKPLMQPAKIFS